MASDIVSGQVSKIIPLCSDDCRLVVYDKDVYSPMASVVAYWNNWLKRVVDEHVSISLTVKWCLYYFRPAVYVDIYGYRSMIILFRLDDESGLIKEITFAPNPLQKYQVFPDRDFNNATYSKRYMLSKIIDNNVLRKAYRLSCPVCGEGSLLLDWHRYCLDFGLHGVVGEVSMCPHCNRVVEMVPTISMRYEEPQKPSHDAELPVVDTPEHAAAPNVYSIIGQQIHQWITECVLQADSTQDNGKLFDVAKSLKPLSDRHIGLHVASCDTADTENESFLYFYSDSNKAEWDKEICRNLKVDNTAMGAWQLYLFMTAQAIMPVSGTGGYIRRTFIFDVRDLLAIQPIQFYDLSILASDGMLMPTVELSDDQAKVDIYCCYWNDWRGLVREHAQVTFNADGTAFCEALSEFVLYPYDCGIRF
jgi:hypothetical protein